MAITDADMLTEVSWRTVEDTLFTSGLWTVTEVAAYFNERQNRFNRDTKLMLASQMPIAAVAGTSVYDLPDDWIATQRAVWKDSITGAITPLERSDQFTAAAGITASNPPGMPTLMDEQIQGTKKCEIFPTPLSDGTIYLLYACTLELMDFDVNPANYDIFDIPDDFVPYVMYGVLADMLSKDGRGQDLQRAKYCSDRYDEGVALAALLISGFA